MADEPQTSVDANGKKGEKGFFKELSGSAAKRLLEPLATTAATAGTAYLMRKTTQIWNQSVLPKIRDKGGGKAFAKDALEQAASKLPGGRGSGSAPASLVRGALEDRGGCARGVDLS